jgi:hypothetical protein
MPNISKELLRDYINKKIARLKKALENDYASAVGQISIGHYT